MHLGNLTLVLSIKLIKIQILQTIIDDDAMRPILASKNWLHLKVNNKLPDLIFYTRINKNFNMRRYHYFSYVECRPA